MRELHVVALSEDGRHVVLATRPGTASGEFRVALGERLAAAVRGELPAPGRDVPPSISPRDIQARLRDGETPEEIAASAGVPLSRVERYAGPVLAELDRMVTGARAAVVSRPRLGPSALPLGEAVEAHLAEVAHLAEGSVRWSARRSELGRWVVGVSWTARGRRRTAGWHYDPARREVTAVDGPSAVLGHVEAEAAPVTASGRTPRPAAPAVASRGTARTAGAAPAAPGRAVRSPAPAAPSPRTATALSSGSAVRPPTAPPAASARAGSPRATVPRPTAAPAPPATVRRAAPAPPAAAARPARRRARASPAEDVPAAAVPAARTSAARAPAGGAPAGSTPPTSTRATGRATPRRTSARRSAVPALDAPAATTGTAGRTVGDAPEPPVSAAARAPEPLAADLPPAGPPVLRVVPPADPEPVADAHDAPAPGAQRVRRVAGQRGARDWADVLMGGGPAAGPHEEQPRA